MTTDYGYVLPDPVDPPETLCIQIRIPNELHHRAAFFGQMWELTRWYNWARDDAHTALQVAAVWLRIYNEIRSSVCPECPPLPHGGIEQEDFMPLRVDCDCNVWVTCCDGTEMQLASLKQLQAPTQPGPQPQPKPGECKGLDATIQANNSLFLPFAVGGGDVITVTNLTGGWYDGGLDGWRCPTGSQYLFGSCSAATGSTHVGDPMPAIPHMALIAQDSAGNYYDARSTFTIAGTVPDQSSLTFFANDSDTSNNAGSASFHVEICKNAHPVAFYYGLCTNFWVVQQHPDQITWYPLPLGVPTTITSLVPDDPSGVNLTAWCLINNATSFDPSTNASINGSGACFKMTIGSLSGGSFSGPGLVTWYPPASACHGLGGVNHDTALPANGTNFAELDIRSHTQFVLTITIEQCS